MTNPAFRQPMARHKWALAVATLCSPSFVADAAASLGAMLPYLMDFPDAAFCAASAEAVATAPRRQSVPALDELRAALNRFQRETVPINQAPWGGTDAGRLGKPTTVAGLLAQPEQDPDERERERAEVLAKAKMLCAELRTQGLTARTTEPVRPAHVSKLALARLARPETLAGRPDLQAALAAAERSRRSEMFEADSAAE